MSPVDLIILSVYLVGIFVFAMFIGRKVDFENFFVGGFRKHKPEKN